MDLLDLLGERGIFPGPLVGRPIFAGIVAAPGDLQYPAQQRDQIVVGLLLRSMILNSITLYPVLPCEKGLEAFRRISFSWRRTLTSFAELPEFLALLGGETFSLSLIDLCLLHPATQRVVVRDAKLLGYLGDAPVRRRPNKANDLSFEF